MFADTGSVDPELFGSHLWIPKYPALLSDWGKAVRTPLAGVLSRLLFPGSCEPL